MGEEGLVARGVWGLLEDLKGNCEDGLTLLLGLHRRIGFLEARRSTRASRRGSFFSGGLACSPIPHSLFFYLLLSLG